MGVIYERLKFNGNIANTSLPKVVTAAQIGTADEAKIDAYYLSVRQAFGPHTIRADYGADRGLKVGGNDIGSTKAKTYALGYSYSLSKRTDVYALYTRIKNDDNSRNDFSINAVSAQTTSGISTLAAGADPQGFGVGFRHTF